MIEIRWHGRGGQGAKTAALLLADVAFNTGKFIQGFPEYGPERMGAPITAYNRIDDKPIRVHSNIYEPDYVVVVDESLLDAVDVTKGLKKEGAIVINTSKSKNEVLPLLKGKKVVIFGVPGAFTPLCSAQHLPGYVAQYDALKAKGVDEIWCVAVNDAFVMAAWGRQNNAIGKVRMLADGSAEYVTKLGLNRDLTGGGMGMRSFRYAMIVEDGVVKYIGVEASGKFEVSNVETVLGKL